MIIEMLKKVCLFVVLFLATFSSAQVYDSITPTVFYYPDSTISSVGTMVESKPDGVWKNFYTTGKIKSIVHWNNGNLDGLSSFYSEDSLLIKTIEYKNDFKNGYVTEYDSVGKVKIKLPYEKDTLHGVAYEYYPNGRIKGEYIYIKGEIQGAKRVFDETDGRLIEVKRYEKDSLVSIELINQLNSRGNKEGYWEDRNENGKIEREGNYVDGKENGLFRVYDKYGKLVELVNYELGKPFEKKAFSNLFIYKKLHDNGKIAIQGPMKGEKRVGVHNFYDTSGYYLYSEIYDYDTLTAKGKMDSYGIYDSTWVFYYSTGEQKSTGNYLNGQKSGKWTFFYNNNKIAQQGVYREDNPHGYWVWYYINGQLRAEENYYRGKLQGEKIEYDSIGKVITKGNYVDDYKDGSWFYYIGDHKETGNYSMGMRDDVWIYYFEETNIVFKGEFNNDLPIGKHREWYGNGRIKEIRRYKSNGKPHGKWKKYRVDGELEYRLYYKGGILVNINGESVRKH